MRYFFLFVAACCVQREPLDKASIDAEANQFATNIRGAAGTSCVAIDSDGDGYCSCTVFREREQPLGILCGCGFSSKAGANLGGTGCKLAPAAMVNTIQVNQ